jgi:hypothetical protein
MHDGGQKTSTVDHVDVIFSDEGTQSNSLHVLLIDI